MGGRPLSALAVVVVPYGPEQQQEEEVVQMLAGALKVLGEAGCPLVGGHTSEGAELALGKREGHQKKKKEQQDVGNCQLIVLFNGDYRITRIRKAGV